MFIVSALAFNYLKMHYILRKINSCRNHFNYALFNGNPTSYPDISASRKKTWMAEESFEQTFCRKRHARITERRKYFKEISLFFFLIKKQQIKKMNKPLTEFVLKPLMFSDTQIHMGGVWGWGLGGGFRPQGLTSATLPMGTQRWAVSVAFRECIGIFLWCSFSCLTSLYY